MVLISVKHLILFPNLVSKFFSCNVDLTKIDTIIGQCTRVVKQEISARLNELFSNIEDTIYEIFIFAKKQF